MNVHLQVAKQEFLQDAKREQQLHYKVWSELYSGFFAAFQYDVRVSSDPSINVKQEPVQHKLREKVAEP